MLRKEAGDAATSAHNAAADAKQAKTDAGNAKTKSDAASTKAGEAQAKASAVGLQVIRLTGQAKNVGQQLADAEAHLRTIQPEADQAQNLLAWLLPRDAGISFRKDEFVQHFKRFNEQKVVVTGCGGQFLPRGDQELMVTAEALHFVLLNATPWEIQETSKGPIVDESCPIIGEGASVFEREDAPRETRQAARTLEAVLDDVLHQTVLVSDVKVEGYSVNRHSYGADVIKIEVRMHPIRPTGPSPDDVNLLRAKLP